MSGPPLLACLDVPRPGIAEDAPALAVGRDGLALIGVFDGLGGAGARVVDGEDGHRSAAYYAARLARRATLDRFANGGLARADARAELSRAIGQALAGRHAAAPATLSAVRSTLLRSYPTTAALLLVEPGEGYADSLAMWAGDSRCYALTAAAGLQQLSLDDTATGADPMRGLREDGRMTNLLSADAPARLRSVARRIAGPALLFVATDGSHTCLPSPMHFEMTLLDALADASCPESWAAALASRLSPIADDDVSLAAVFTGWASLAAAAACLADRRAWLSGLLDTPLDQAWDSYRPGYLALAEIP